MGRKKIIVMLGIIAMVLLAFQVVYARDVAYTKSGYVACDQAAFSDLSTYWRQRDFKAVDELVEKGRCIWLKAGVQVYFEHNNYCNCAEIHLPGSTKILRTFTEALDMSGTPPKVETAPASPIPTREWFVLKSFL